MPLSFLNVQHIVTCIINSTEEVAFSFNGGKDSTVSFDFGLSVYQLVSFFFIGSHGKLNVQVLLHILRAAFFLHKEEEGCSVDGLKEFPIRTIYFESSSAFPEINSFTYDMATK